MKNHRNRRSSVVRQAVESLECRRLLAGNLLLSLGDVIREVTPGGAIVRDIPVPGTSLGGVNPTYASAVAVDGAGRIHVARTGASHALLTFANGSWTTRTSADWTVLTTLTDVAVTSTQVLVSDISSATTVPAAIRTFPLTGSAAAGRLGTSYYSGIDVSPAGAIHGIKTGLGITPTYNSISPTGAAGTSVTVHVSASSVAADSASTVFVGRGYGYSVSSLDRFSNGVQNGTVNVAIDGDFDLDIASDGTIAMYGYGINADSFVALARTNLTFLDSFAVDLNPGQAPFDITFASADSNANAGGPYTVAEGASVQLTGGVFFGNATTYEWDLNYNGTTFDVDSTSMTPTFSAASLDGPLTRTVALRVRDGAGPLSAVATTSVTVNNANPTAAFSNSGPVVVGQSATVQFTGQNDSSAADRAAGYKYSYDFQNDGTFEIVDSTTASANVPTGILSTAGAKVLRGKITDKDGGSTEYTTTLNVNTVVGTVTGTVYEDTDGDGVRDAGEAGIAGRTVFADLNANYEFDSGEPSVTTAANGTYTLAGLAAGAVNLIHQIPETSDYTSPALGLVRLNVVGNQTVTAAPMGARQRNTRQYLDPTFGNLGETVLPNTSTRTTVAVKQLPTGNYAVVSMVNNVVVVSRFTPNGALDTTFGNGGATTPLLPAGFVVDDVAMMSDGRLVLGGHGSGGADLQVAVLTTAGAADTSFSGDGFQTVDFTGIESLRDVEVDPINNRVVLLGSGEAGEILLARLNVSGTPDFSFGTEGKAFFNLNSQADEPTSLAIQSDGAILVAGTRTFTTGRMSGLVFRVTTLGTADLTYGSAGSRVIDTSSGTLRITDVIVQSNNRAILAGEAQLGLLYFTRLNTTGTTDSSFGDNGSRLYFPGLNGFPLNASNPRLSVNASGFIAFGAKLDTGPLGGPTGQRIAVGMFNSLGMPEVNYLPGGTLIQSFTGAEGDSAFGDVTILPDNRILVAGTAAASVVGGNKLGLFRTALIQPRANLSGNVFSDLNNNGIQETGEPAAAGRVVYIDLNEDGERQTGEPFATTDQSGNYAISGILGGQYKLRLTAPEGFVQSLPTGELPISLTLAPSQTLTNQNFGIHEIPPVIEANPGGPYTVAEGGSVQLIGNAAGAPITVYEWDFDYDGITFTVDSTTQSPLFSAADLDGPITRTLGLRARSGSFPSSPIATTTLTIENVAPVALFTNNGPINAGQTGTVTFSAQNDPSAADRAAGFKYSYDFNNDGTIEIVDSTSATANLPAGLTASAGTVNVRGIVKDKDGGTRELVTNLTVNPGPAPGQITGKVFDDIDRDGVQDTGELGIVGRTVYIDADNDNVLDAGEQSTQTFAGGIFDLIPVAPGSYVVRQVVPAGLVQTLPSGNAGRNVTVVSGQNSMNVNFATAAAPPGATISGTVFLDADRDGVFDAGESGVAARTIYLDNNNNGIKDASEPSTATAADGTYSFTGLSAGTYKIRQILPTGFVQTTPANNFGNNATVSGTQVAANLNFGTAQNVTPTGATIRGTVFLDTDRDGVFDSGEAGVAGRTVYLDLDNDSILDGNERSTTTNASGVYEFGGLAAGTYKIRQVLPSGFIQTTPANNFGNNATVSGTQVADGRNFGTAENVTPTGATIRGTVFLDADRDGVFDSGEAGVSGRTVYLDLDNDSILDGNERSTTTNASGVYEFGGLAAGTYKIRQVLPSDFIQTTPSNNFGNNATVSGTQVVSGLNFGTAQNTAPTGGTIRGTVWNDVDRDRNFDSNESGIGGRTVYIDLDNDNVKDGNEPSAVTNSTGVYEIGGLAAGTYKVRQVLPSGFSQTSPTNGFGNNVTLSTNQTRSGINFGSAANASRMAAATTTTQKLDSISKSIFAEELIA